ncbi:MAG: hypothetical protein R3Y43_00900 [Alphaproteobacteria bacterium]
MKRLIYLLSFFVVTSCSVFSDNEDIGVFAICPNVLIPRKSAYLTQKSSSFEDFQVQIVGVEGYCYYDRELKTNKAVITPVFELSRLAPSKDCQVDFKFFTETLDGPPEYLGKWRHHQSASINYDQKSIKFKGKTLEQRIPVENESQFIINLGLVQTQREKVFNQRTFDIKFDYIEE